MVTWYEFGIDAVRIHGVLSVARFSAILKKSRIEMVWSNSGGYDVWYFVSSHLNIFGWILGMI
jgi:hypothetical protein